MIPSNDPKIAKIQTRLEELRREFPSINDDVLLERIKLESEEEYNYKCPNCPCSCPGVSPDDWLKCPNCDIRMERVKKHAN